MPDDSKFFTPGQGMLYQTAGGGWHRADGKPLTELDRAVISGESQEDYWDRKDREAAEAKRKAKEGK